MQRCFAYYVLLCLVPTTNFIQLTIGITTTHELSMLMSMSSYLNSFVSTCDLFHSILTSWALFFPFLTNFVGPLPAHPGRDVVWRSIEYSRGQQSSISFFLFIHVLCSLGFRFEVVQICELSRSLITTHWQKNGGENKKLLDGGNRSSLHFLLSKKIFLFFFFWYIVVFFSMSVAS